MVCGTGGVRTATALIQLHVHRRRRFCARLRARGDACRYLHVNYSFNRFSGLSLIVSRGARRAGKMQGSRGVGDTTPCGWQCCGCASGGRPSPPATHAKGLLDSSRNASVRWQLAAVLPWVGALRGTSHTASARTRRSTARTGGTIESRVLARTFLAACARPRPAPTEAVGNMLSDAWCKAELVFLPSHWDTDKRSGRQKRSTSQA